MSFESGIAKAQGAQTSDSNSLSIALGASSNGRLFEDVNKARAEFNPVKESALKLEAADAPLMATHKTVFSQQQQETGSQGPPQENSKEVGQMLGNTAITGSMIASDRNYSPAAVMAADAKIFKKSNAA